MAFAKIPRHVAVIMDGNGRWAQNKGLPREEGHVAGAIKVPEIARYLFESGVSVVSLYAFSQENFARPVHEVEGIFKRIEEFVLDFQNSFKGVKLIISGDLDAVSPSLKDACLAAMDATEKNGARVLNIMINYGGRAEILRAARFSKGESEESFRSALYTGDLPDPDLIIRTGGEKRLSGFMPYQSAYSELYFSDVLFPDITETDLFAALEDYARRDRRFGSAK